MRNLKLTIQYEGTEYSGWQFQKNGLSVQEVIQKAVKMITGENVCVVGSGRTDAGVHAEAQVANFKTRSKVPLKKFRMGLNSVLPKDIAISGMEEVGLRFNAQHDAKGKFYRYVIANNDFVNPLLRRFVTKCFYPLDLGDMKKAARYLTGRHDYKSFQAKDGIERNAVRTVRKIAIEKKGDLVYITMEADGFVYNMARNIVGTLIEVGRGKIRAKDVKAILRKKERRLCGPTVPARGLCLVRVKY